MKKAIFCFAVLSLVFATSCGGDDDNDAPSCTELTATFSAKTQAFVDNPDDPTACSEYKVAAQAYLDADCITGENAATLQTSVSAIDCSTL